MKERNYYLVELDDLVDELNRRDQEKAELIPKLEQWLDTLNYWDDEVSEAADRLNKPGRYDDYSGVIDDIYNLLQRLRKDME